MSIDLGTWFSSDLRFADEFCCGSSSITESVHTFDKSPTRLPSFYEVAFINTNDDDDDEEAADKVALLLDDDSCSSLNKSASTPDEKTHY